MTTGPYRSAGSTSWSVEIKVWQILVALLVLPTLQDSIASAGWI